MTELIIPPDKIFEIMDNIGKRIVEHAVEKAPVDLGALRLGIKHRIDGNTLVVYCDIPYAENLEYDKGPIQNVNKEAIRDWVRRHNQGKDSLAITRGVIKSLQTKGIRVGTVANPLHITSFGRNSYRPFLRPAVHKVMNTDVGRIIEGVLNK